jgi:hypothetical protein
VEKGIQRRLETWTIFRFHIQVTIKRQLELALTPLCHHLLPDQHWFGVVNWRLAVLCSRAWLILCLFGLSDRELVQLRATFNSGKKNLSPRHRVHSKEGLPPVSQCREVGNVIWWLLRALLNTGQSTF